MQAIACVNLGLRGFYAHFHNIDTATKIFSYLKYSYSDTLII